MTNKQAALKVIKRLRKEGFEAFFAGGCVRDMLLGRAAKDYDVATSAEPIHIIRMFKRTLKIGAHFGVVVVLLDDKQVEVATFRTDIGYEDGRRPTKVKFVSAAQDAGRRDFTINGMFYDPLEDKVIDYVNGRADLKKKLIRTIGEPENRFAEDYLRMLRAVRFATQLDFTIEKQTWSAICDNSASIAKISGERKQMELEAILVNQHRSHGAAMLIKSSLANAIFPGFDGQEAKFSIKTLSKLREKIDFPLALACFFADFPAKFAMERCVALRLSRNQNRHMKFLLSNRGRLLDDNMSLADLRKIVAEPYFEDLYQLQKAIQQARKDGKVGAYALIRLRKRINALGDLELKPKPLLNGHDLIRLGAVSGRGLGQLAEEMYIAQLESKLQTVEQAEGWIRKWLKNHKKFEKNSLTLPQSNK